MAACWPGWLSKFKLSPLAWLLLIMQLMTSFMTLLRLILRLMRS